MRLYLCFYTLPFVTSDSGFILLRLLTCVRRITSRAKLMRIFAPYTYDIIYQICLHPYKLKLMDNELNFFTGFTRTNTYLIGVTVREVPLKSLHQKSKTDI